MDEAAALGPGQQGGKKRRDQSPAWHGLRVKTLLGERAARCALPTVGEHSKPNETKAHQGPCLRCAVPTSQTRQC